MVPWSCGKDGCKSSNRQSMGPQLEETQGKKYPNTTTPPTSQTPTALRCTVKHVIVEREVWKTEMLSFFSRDYSLSCLTGWGDALQSSFLKCF